MVDPDAYQDGAPPQEALRRMINSYRITQLVYIAAELGLADLMKDGPRRLDELAGASGTQPQPLYRLLRALCSLGVFVRRGDDRFGLAALGEYLQTGAAGSLRAWALQSGGEQYPAWAQLLYSLRTGKTAFDALHGMSAWQYRQQHPRANQIFNDAMSAVVHPIGQALVSAYDFSPFHRVVDVGGGQGLLLMAILKAFPSVRGILFDQPQAIQEARELLGPAGLLDRCELVEGNFFEAVPTGGDAYLLMRILHDWEDGQVIRLLENCRKAMQPQHKLLILEQKLDAQNPEPEACLMDLNMLVMLGGRERTDAEYESLLNAAGFKLARVFATASPMQILEAVAVNSRRG